MTHNYDVSPSIIDFMSDRDLRPSDYLLYSAGQAVSMARIAADELENMGGQLFGGDYKLAVYHTYAGVSATRTALDNLANWLLDVVEIDDHGLAPHRIDFTEKDFRKFLRREVPDVAGPVESLRKLAREIDPVRQSVQHKQGVSILSALHHAENRPISRWYFKPLDVKSMKDPAVRDAQDISIVIRRWADRIEKGVNEILHVFDAGPVSLG